MVVSGDNSHFISDGVRNKSNGYGATEKVCSIGSVAQPTGFGEFIQILTDILLITRFFIKCQISIPLSRLTVAVFGQTPAGSSINTPHVAE